MDLGEGLRKALAKITGAAIVDEKVVKEAVKDIQRILLSSDVNVKLVFELSKRIEERALKEKDLPGFSVKEKLVKIIYDELVQIIGDKYEPKVKPQKILLCGLFGSGKTTSTAKIAKFFSSKGLKVGAIACDVYRPAAFEQLKQICESIKCEFYGEKGEKDAGKIAQNALKTLKSEVIILDSAGRSAFDAELSEELKRIKQAFKPDEIFLVVSADIGQVAGKQAQEFKNALGEISGVIVTKMDGSAKGGGALSAVHSAGTKVAFIASGEKPEAFEVFDSKKFVSRLLGFPDLPALLDKVKEVSQEENLEKLLESEELNFETFLAQMKTIKKMGPMKQIMQMMGMYDIPQNVFEQSEAKLKKMEAAVHSMTKAERKDPDSLKSKSRQERIAKGAGITAAELKEMIASFEKTQKMMKGLKRNRGMMKNINKMMGGFKGI